MDGRFNCTTENCGSKKCPGNQTWVQGGVMGAECARQCDTLHLPCLNTRYTAGCKCPGAQVWDKTRKTCVEPYQCPCHYQGRSYNQGQSFKWDCNTWYTPSTIYLCYSF